MGATLLEKIKHGIYKNGQMINHRPPFKVWINNFLRLAQFWTKNKYIITSEFDSFVRNGELVLGVLTGYSFKRIEHKYYLPKLYKEDAKT